MDMAGLFCVINQTTIFNINEVIYALKYNPGLIEGDRGHLCIPAER